MENEPLKQCSDSGSKHTKLSMSLSSKFISALNRLYEWPYAMLNLNNDLVHTIKKIKQSNNFEAIRTNRPKQCLL